MKIIKTDGIGNLTELPGSGGWYWCCDYASGDLYEAQELFESGRPVRSNRLLFIHYPDGRIAEPLRAEAGQYFGQPEFFDGALHILMVDFPKSAIRIFRCDAAAERASLLVELPLSETRDCCNLMLQKSPLMLIRQGSDDIFQMIWPEKCEFKIGPRETFCSRDGDRLYFTSWTEERGYTDEVVIRSFPSGEVLEVITGALWELPDGQRWILQ